MYTGVCAWLQRPLDFLVVADHAENLGLAPMIAEKNPELLKTDFGRKVSQLVYAGKYWDAYTAWGEGMSAHKDPLKGDGEAHPSLSPNDEFADYGTWDKGSFGPEPKTPEMLPREYAREVLKRGMKYEGTLGANPFKFGVIGSTDTHTSLATTEENNYLGKATPGEPAADPERFEEKITGMMQKPNGPDITMRHFQTIAAGLAAVWATENTRKALWDALNRREVYTSTAARSRWGTPWTQDGDLHQQHWRRPDDGLLEGSRFQSEATGLVLRPRGGDPDAALDRLRRSLLRRPAAAGR